MTAGQRNSYLAIQDLLVSYGYDDVLFALREHVLEESQNHDPKSAEFRICRDVHEQIEQLRGWMRTALSKRK